MKLVASYLNFNTTYFMISDWYQCSGTGLHRRLPGHLGRSGCSTIHLIYTPSTEPRCLFYRRDKHSHFLSTQVTVNNVGIIMYCQAGFLGHTNDADAFAMMPNIGPEMEVSFPSECYLLADTGYRNEYTVMTPYEAPALRGSLNIWS